MIRTVILDSGALIAAEKGEMLLTALLKAVRASEARVLIPSAVIAETWRGTAPHANISRLVNAAHGFPPLDFEAGKRIGTLLGRVSRPSVVDASVADAALRHAPSLIVTSDPKDLRELLNRAAGADVRIYSL